MRRVSRRPCEDGPLLEEQETEGQRQLHGLLLQQLHTDVDIERCVAKRKCFAPSSLYRPFGEQAAGVRTLTQFQALQDGQTELDRLRELGLTETEVQLWRTRDQPETQDKAHGVSAAPGARQQRLQLIRDKMEAREELLNRPQRFNSSQPLTRREMEIERSLFQGADRRGFLTALYHRDEDAQDGQKGGASTSDPMDSLYRDVLNNQAPAPNPAGQSQDSQGDGSQSEETTDRQSESTEPQIPEDRPGPGPGPGPGLPGLEPGPAPGLPPGPGPALPGPALPGPPPELGPAPPGPAPGPGPGPLAGPTHLDLSRPIRSLRCAAPSSSPLTVRGEVETISDQEILENREPTDSIRTIPRFRDYEPGEPSKVLCVKNLSPQASVSQLVSLFSRFQRDGDPVLYRLLTGRMKGQAFITLPDVETAQNALQLVHGYRLLGKPLVVEFGRDGNKKNNQS